MVTFRINLTASANSLSLFLSSSFRERRNDNFVWKNVKNFSSVGRELNLLQLYVQPGKQGKARSTNKANFSQERQRKCCGVHFVCEFCRLEDASRECILGSLLFFDLLRMSNKSAGWVAVDYVGWADAHVCAVESICWPYKIQVRTMSRVSNKT